MEYKNGKGIRKFLQDPFRWNVFSVHEPLNYKIVLGVFSNFCHLSEMVVNRQY